MDIIEDLKLLLQPVDVAHLFAIRGKIVDKICTLDASVQKSKEPVPFEKRNENIKPIKKGKKWADIFECAWFNFKGQVPKEYVNKDLCVVVDVSGEGLIVDDNNNALQGITNPLAVANVGDFLNLTFGKTLYHLPKGTTNIDLWVDCGFNGIMGKQISCGRLRRADLAVYNNDVCELYFDYLSLAFLKVNYKNKDKTDTSRALGKAFSLFKKGDILGARKVLEPCLSKPTDYDLTVTAIGHSHLDLAWLWPIRETKRKSARTISNALKNMSLFDNYIYGGSQPQQFEWIKENYPQLFEKIKQACKDGKFEPQGGMWCECDTNITGGESLVRQFIYGIDYWKKEFDFDVNNCWLPDVFGYTASLPQIIKKCGLNYFMTQKLSWNNINEFPYETFMWEGISNDKVLTHLLPGNTYNSSGAAPSLNELYRNHKRKDTIPEALMLYGAGDGGGGPCEANIALIKRYENVKGAPKVNFGRACDFFERIKKYQNDIPKHKGELYLEKHQGTFTTQSDNKKLNRKSEFALHDLEMLGAVAIRKGYNYPYEKIKTIWKEIMLYQFHDILPGSSITRVYDESVPRYKKLISEIEEERNNIIEFLKKADGQSVLNTAPYDRHEYIKYNDNWYHFDAPKYSSAKLIPEKCNLDGLKATDNHIENNILKVTFSKSGEIVSLINKKTGNEFNGKYLNRLSVYHDKFMAYDAWDIDINYTKKHKSKFRLISSKSFVDGMRAIYEAHYKYNKSTLFQKVILYYDKPYIEFNTRVDWHETHKMLRADFIPKNYSDKVTCDIQFGNIKRSTKTDNKIDYAQFEVPAHKYIDVSTDKGGSAILSSSKYGFRAKDGLMSINLLRSPVYPDKKADRGKHHFRYAYYPHEGDCEKADVSKQAYLFNYAPVIVEGDIDILPIVNVDKQNIVVETIKPAENGCGVIIRAYENCGKDTNCEFTFNIAHNKIYNVNLVEEVIDECNGVVDFKPYEIKTLLLK